MRFLHPILTTVLFAASSAGAPSAARAQTADAAATFEARLERLVERLDTEYQAAHIPGMAIAVVKDDAIVLARGFGLADLEAREAVTPETLFAVGSTTKAFTATLIAMLVDEGVLGWDDPVTDELPYFTLAVDGDEGAVVTLRDLCSHRTGFTRMSMLWGGGSASRETILRTAAGAEPWRGFRAGFNYNNVMFLAAGEAAASAAGTGWDELLATRILEPLGMDDSNTSVARSLEDARLAKGYVWDEEKQAFERKPMRVLDAIGPAGAINSNVLDMAQWVRFQLGRGALDGRRLLDAERLEETWEREVTVGGEVGYGLGWFLRTWNGLRIVEHGGNIDGFSAQVAFSPESNLGYVLLANVSYTPLQIGSIGIVFDALLGEDGPPGAGDAESHAELVGGYTASFASFADATFTVSSKDGRLAVDVPGQMNFELKEPDEDGKRYFKLTDEVAVSFERDETGRVVGMRMYQNGFAFELPRQGVEVEPDPVPSGALRYVGKYQDEKLGLVEVLLKDNNRLAVDVPGQMVFELRPPNADGEWVFRVRDGVSVRFNEDAEGRVVSLTSTQDGKSRDLVRAHALDEVPLPSLSEVLALSDVERRGKALEAACGMRASGSVRFVNSGLEGTVTLLIGGHDRYRSDIDLGPFGVLRGAAVRGKGSAQNPFNGFEELDGVRLAQLVEGNPLAAAGDWRRAFSSIAVERTDELDGRAVIVLTLGNEGVPPVTFFVDAGNGDLLKTETTVVEGPVKLPVTTTFGDFREVAGVRMAFRVTSENEANGRTVAQIETWETGLELTDADFVLRDPVGR